MTRAERRGHAGWVSQAIAHSPHSPPLRKPSAVQTRLPRVFCAQGGEQTTCVGLNPSAEIGRQRKGPFETRADVCQECWRVYRGPSGARGWEARPGRSEKRLWKMAMLHLILHVTSGEGASREIHR